MELSKSGAARWIFAESPSHVGLARAILGCDLDPSMPLTQAGFDSLASVEFSQAISGAFSLALPATLVYDYPTLNAVAAYVARSSMQEQEVKVGLRCKP